MKKKYPILENIEIEALAGEGKALAHIDGKVCFVPFAAPGDVVDLQVTNKRKSFLEAKIVNFHKKSNLRIAPICRHFTICGGCKWQHIPYETQLLSKQQIVSDNLQRIGGINLNDVEILPIAASENQFLYRNKLEYTFSNRRWFVSNEEHNSQNNALGFHIPAMFDRVLDIEACHLQSEPSNKIRNFIKDYALKNELTFYDVKNHIGFFRNVIIRNNEKGEVMLIVVFGEEVVEKIEKLMETVKDNFPEITSLQYVINTKLNDTIGDLNITCYAGKDCIVEEYCTERHSNTFLRFKIGAKSFFQTNTRQAEKLYSVAKEFAELQGNEIVYDLYTGCGTIAQFIADKAKKVVGIEYVDAAIADAKENAKLNGIAHCEFFAGDMSKVLTDDFIAKYGKPDVIITDPPRAGMNPDVVAQILKIKPQKIVYISCNSATQARDIAMLKSAYKIIKSQAIDMFPQTHHIENIVKLEIR